MGTKLNKTQTEYTLKSLKEPQNVDPFQELTVTYSGISGLGQAQPGEVALPLPVTFSVIKQTGLKNGDNIKVTASYDDAAAKRSGYIVTQEEKEFTVSGLTEPETVNIFEAAPITFTGISGAGEMTVDSKNLKFPVSIKADKETGLENGDVVTVTAQADPNDLLSKGYILAETTRTVTVEGLTEPQNYDVFQNIVTSFSGFSGGGELTVDTAKIPFPAEITADRSTGLKNGDTVNLTAKGDAGEILKKGYILTETLKPVQVSGLTEPQPYDLFSNVAVTFEGFSGDAKAEPKVSGVPFKVELASDKSSGLNNGDVIKVKAMVDYLDAMKNGYTVTEKGKDFTVSGLKEVETVNTDTIFEALELNFAGISPDLTLTYSNKLVSKYRNYFTFELKPKTPAKKTNSYDTPEEPTYKIGDEVTFNLEYDGDKLRKNGLKIEGPTSKTITIDNTMCDSYISEFEYITPDIRETFIKEAEDAIKAQLSSAGTYDKQYFNLPGDYGITVHGEITIGNPHKVYFAGLKPGMEKKMEEDRQDNKFYNALFVSFPVDTPHKDNRAKMVMFSLKSGTLKWARMGK